MRPLPNLDLLRSIAVCLVLVDHTSIAMNHTIVGTWQLPWLGVFGVYLFFVHTTLVLMWSLHRQPHVLNFYIRRVFRIYPLAIAAISLILIFNVPLASPPNVFAHIHFTPTDVVRNLFLIQNLWNSINMEGVMWSLPLEVQMYVVLPALFVYANREKQIWQLLVLWALAVVTVHQFEKSGNTFVTVVPDFLCGIIAYVAFGKFRPRFPAWSFVPALIVLMTAFMWKPSVRMSWPICLALGLMLPLFLQITNAAVVRTAHLVAQYSYGIYLGHSFGIFIGFHVLARRSLWLQLTSELLFTGVFAVVAYHLIEEPFIRLGSRLARYSDTSAPAPLAGADPLAPEPARA